MIDKEIFKEFLSYVSLNILGQMAYSCYTMADTFFVSARLGADGLTALNLAFPIFCLINGTGLMIGMGGGTRYLISRSRGETSAADRIFTNALYLAAGFALLFVLAGVFFTDSIVVLLGADTVVFEMTSTYLRFMLLFAPAFLANNLLICFVRNDGKPSLAMTAMITGSLSNVLLDYIFIFPLDMGIFGAIFATGFAPVISIIIMAPYILSRSCGFAPARRSLNIRIDGEILSSGVPSFLTEATSGIVMFLFNFIILRISGNTGVAAFSIITVISLVVVAVFTGLSQGIQPIISRSYGGGNLQEVKLVFRYGITSMIIIAAVIFISIYLGADIIASVFNSEGNLVLQEYAVSGLKLYFTAVPFLGFNIVLSTYFISTEKTLQAQLISLMRSFIILVPMAFLLSAVLKMTGVWLTYPVTELVVAGIALLIFLRSRRIR